MSTEEEMSSAHVYHEQDETAPSDPVPTATQRSRQSSVASGERRASPAALESNYATQSEVLGQGLLEPEVGVEAQDAVDRDLEKGLHEGSDKGGDGKPHQPEPPVKMSSIPRAAFNIFKGNVGAGVFLLPTAYTEAGYILGPIFAILSGLMVIDCSLMLLRCKTRIGRAEVQTYPAVAKFVYGDVMLMIVNVALVLTQFGFVLLYLQFSAGIFEHLANFDGAYKVYVLAGTIFVTPLTFLTNKLHLLAYSSFLATFCVFYCIFTTFSYSATTLKDDPSDSYQPVESPSKWVLFFASQMTVLEGIGIVLPVENSVKHKEKFPGMLRATLLSIVVMYLIYGIVGYIAYGSELSESLVNILADNAFTSTIRIALAAELLLTAPLQFVPAIQIIDRSMGVEPHRITSSTRAIAARIMIMLLLMIMGMLLPADTLSLVLAFIGSIAATFIALILPGFLELLGDYASEHPDCPRNGAFIKNLTKGGCTFRRARAWFYVFFGLLIMGVGTVTCVIDATKLFGHKVGQSTRPATRNITQHNNVTLFGF